MTLKNVGWATEINISTKPSKQWILRIPHCHHSHCLRITDTDKSGLQHVIVTQRMPGKGNNNPSWVNKSYKRDIATKTHMFEKCSTYLLVLSKKNEHLSSFCPLRANDLLLQKIVNFFKSKKRRRTIFMQNFCNCFE